MTLQVELVSPEEVLYSGEADMVIARTTDGEIAFMTGHAPFIGSLGVGAVTIRTSEGDDVRAAVHEGFVEVTDNRVTILSDIAELVGDIDATRARRALEELDRERDVDDAEAETALRRARLRVELADE
ncbi:MAG: F0F1 ATP synthase subunit epsilon [Actinobacteria bacterium]|nr:F0F1 ATP synthase subunit epsilon [Actinomycetota bacterium]MBW3642525.1 F0F1 ATP synthase subunit epsilon [Actinomycetota bacterium]